MEPIPEAVVEEIWREVAAFSSDQAGQAMEKTAKKQRELISFIDAYTEDLSQEAAELAFYMFFTIYRIFQRSTRARIKPIKGSKIERCLDNNEDLLGRLEGAHEKFVERVAKVESSRQPHVMRYLVETLMEAPEGEDPVFLTEEETGALFLVLKTVIDVLEEKVDQNSLQSSSVPEP